MLRFTSYAHAKIVLIEAGAVRVADNKLLFEYNPFPSVAYKMPDNTGIILHYNGGRGALSATKTWDEAMRRVDSSYRPKRVRGYRRLSAVA